MTTAAVVGVGAIGSVFAAALQDAGRDAVLCTRSPSPSPSPSASASPSASPSRAVEGTDGRVTVLNAPAVTSADEIQGPVDWVLLAVKAHQTAGAADWLRKLTSDRTTVLVLQNGVDHRERVAPFAGQAQVLPAVLWCPAEPAAPHLVRQRGPARVILPAGPAGERAAALLHGGRVEVELTGDFVTQAWRKLTHNAVGALMALTGRTAGVFGDEEMARLAERLAAECLAVGRAEGAQIDGTLPAEVVAALVRGRPEAGSSILTDRLAGRRLEWEARNGVVQRLGARHAIPTPVSDAIVPLLACCGPATG